MTIVPTGCVMLVLDDVTIQHLVTLRGTAAGALIGHQLEEFETRYLSLVQEGTGLRVQVVDLRAVPEPIERRYLSLVPMAVKVGDPPPAFQQYFSENPKDFDANTDK